VTYVFAPPPVASVAVQGETARFPVRRIFCVGRNYAAHAREMGKDPDREPPFFFTKPADAVVDAEAGLGAMVPYPPETSDFQFEIELTIAIGKAGANIPRATALDHVFGYAVSIDLTRRDLQMKAREQGRPWDWGKAFDLSAPLAAIRPAASAGDVSKRRIWLSVDGVVKQDASIADLIWDVPEIIAIISSSMALQPGDLIMTGTPAGVGPLKPGQTVRGGIDGLGELELLIGPAA
jgi:fumarylpyruvate hydrolase